MRVRRASLCLLLIFASATVWAQNKVPAKKVSQKAPLAAVPGEYPGEIRAFAGEQCPANWLVADGKELDTSAHKGLEAAISDLWGASAPGKFNLPDLRGVFLRGWNQSRAGTGADPEAPGRQIPPGAPIDATLQGNQVGTYQDDQFGSHSHQITQTARWGDKVADTIGWGADNGQHPHGNFSIPTSAAGGPETRPKNVYILYCIRDGK
jgi:microcystin-dependent protein